MEIVNFFTIAVVPFFVALIVFCGVREKKNVFDLFMDGVEDGLKMIFKLFPTLLRIVFCY